MHRARDCPLASSQSTSGFVLLGSVCEHVLDGKQTVRSLKDVGSAEPADQSSEILWQTFSQRPLCCQSKEHLLDLWCRNRSRRQVDHQSTSDFPGQGPDGVSKIRPCCASSAVFGRDQLLTVDLFCEMVQYQFISILKFSSFTFCHHVNMSLQRKSPNVKVV